MSGHEISEQLCPFRIVGCDGKADQQGACLARVQLVDDFAGSDNRPLEFPQRGNQNFSLSRQSHRPARPIEHFKPEFLFLKLDAERQDRL